MDPRVVAGMIVTDNDDFFGSMSAALAEAGVDRVARSNSDDNVLEELGREPVSIVIIDDQLPECDGIATTRTIRHEPASPAPRAIIMLALDRTSIQRTLDAVGAGAHEVLLKPFDEVSLALRIKSLILAPPHFIDVETYVGPDRRQESGSRTEPDRRERSGDEEQRQFV